MKARVIRTHRAGIPVDRREWDRVEPALGQIVVSLQVLDGLKRASRGATLRPTERSTSPPVIPDLYDIDLIAFGNTGMMIAGFEEVSNRRFYQSWWIRWDTA